MMNFSIRCEVCGKEMEFDEPSCYPGTNDRCLVVKPCCNSKDTEDLIHKGTEHLDAQITTSEEVCDEIQGHCKEVKDLIMDFEISIDKLEDMPQEGIELVSDLRFDIVPELSETNDAAEWLKYHCSKLEGIFEGTRTEHKF